MTPDETNTLETARRQALMRVCAYATESELKAALVGFAGTANAEDLRAPEEGLVMLRGRIGGDGQRFNVGEATVTRAAVRLDDGTLGYAYLLGRCPRKARLAAIVDALGQRADMRAMLDAVLVAPVMARRKAGARERREGDLAKPERAEPGDECGAPHVTALLNDEGLIEANPPPGDSAEPGDVPFRPSATSGFRHWRAATKAFSWRSAIRRSAASAAPIRSSVKSAWSRCRSCPRSR